MPNKKVDIKSALKKNPGSKSIIEFAKSAKRDKQSIEARTKPEASEK
jgi:hypothetical protein